MRDESAPIQNSAEDLQTVPVVVLYGAIAPDVVNGAVSQDGLGDIDEERAIAETVIVEISNSAQQRAVNSQVRPCRNRAGNLPNAE